MRDGRGVTLRVQTNRVQRATNALTPRTKTKPPAGICRRALSVQHISDTVQNSPVPSDPQAPLLLTYFDSGLAASASTMRASIPTPIPAHSYFSASDLAFLKIADARFVGFR